MKIVNNKPKNYFRFGWLKATVLGSLIAGAPIIVALDNTKQPIKISPNLFPTLQADELIKLNNRLKNGAITYKEAVDSLDWDKRLRQAFKNGKEFAIGSIAKAK